MKMENEAFMQAIAAKHGPFYAHATQMVAICSSTVGALMHRQESNADTLEVVAALEMLAGETYVQYSAICGQLGKQPAGGLEMAADAKELAAIMQRITEQLNQLDRLVPTTRAN